MQHNTTSSKGMRQRPQVIDKSETLPSWLIVTQHICKFICPVPSQWIKVLSTLPNFRLLQRYLHYQIKLEIPPRKNYLKFNNNKSNSCVFWPVVPLVCLPVPIHDFLGPIHHLVSRLNWLPPHGTFPEFQVKASNLYRFDVYFIAFDTNHNSQASIMGLWIPPHYLEEMLAEENFVGPELFLH